MNIQTGISFFLAVLLFHTPVSGQEIDFGSFSSTYSMTLTETNPADELDFGVLIQNEGLAEIDIFDAKVFGIEGVRYLDVIVEITADQYLLLNGDLACTTNPSCRLPFTLQAAYANRGQDNVNQALNMNVVGTVATAQFPIRNRTTAAPGPPPTPTYVGYNPALFNETAFLYLYGSVTVGAVQAGSYTGELVITVSYD